VEAELRMMMVRCEAFLRYRDDRDLARVQYCSTSAKRIFDVEKTMLEVVEKLLIER
jgi:hypothetical protein